MEKTFEFGGTSLYGFAGKQQVVIAENLLTIVKGGLANALTMSNGEKSFDIGQITGVQVKKNGFMPGYMQISSVGNSDIRQGNINALSSENAVVIYSAEQYESALEVKKYVEENRSKFRNSPTVFVQEKSVAEQIKEFKGLVDQGIITESEFEAKKKQLLGL